MGSIRRSHIYVVAVAAVFAAAIGLRISSGRHRAEVKDRATSSSIEPSDYVARPWVVDEERHAGPRRIISLAPNITETVCALGLSDRLIGRTQYCKYPP